MADLSNLTIGVRAFLRDEKMMRSVQGILETMPEVKIIVADDSDPDMSSVKEEFYADLVRHGHKVILLPYDSGFGMKSNKIVDALDRPFLLMGSDDFSFGSAGVREGIEKMVDVLEQTDMSVASGRVKGHGAYEFNLEEQEGGIVIEHPANVDGGSDLWFVQIDLSVNYSIFKKHVFEKVRWEDDVKIQGGEHGSQFVKLKRSNFKVAFVPGAEISEIEGLDSKLYRQMRLRHTDPPRVCFDRIGVKKYVLGSGQVDYDATIVRN